jgi:hypothetical protein
MLFNLSLFIFEFDLLFVRSKGKKGKMVYTIIASLQGLAGPQTKVFYDVTDTLDHVNHEIAFGLCIKVDKTFLLCGIDGNLIETVEQMTKLKRVYLIVTKQVILDLPDEVAAVVKRRTLYMRPFFVYYIICFMTELLFLVNSYVFFDDDHPLYRKCMWTLVICSLGMGATVGCCINWFVTDRCTPNQAVGISAVIATIILSICNYLFFRLGQYFDYWGARKYPWYFHIKYPLIVLMGIGAGKLMYSKKGFRMLTKWGL